jgi:hypothetical protein
MTPIAIEEYQDAMRDAVCGVCVSFTEDRRNPGRCIHETTGECGLFEKLNEVVGVISGINSNSIEPYTNALRREICAKCDHQDASGNCDLRNSRSRVPNWCILDTYFNLIVGAIEEAQRVAAENRN